MGNEQGLFFFAEKMQKLVITEHVPPENLHLVGYETIFYMQYLLLYMVYILY